ncbi:PREDICTED: transmembrane emp24 domain-containing protein p24delta9-like [Erythranthe guttata]|uniref:transmembrane emp24 domain-containing protein p24delta9-like n=1 Tax=Erythranthe guttata TaxID=4155 RepID=UPI00064DEC3D|nr:PREDICTED: transmembrane emp24 domain-containing protein p24delta9-like [Erythranthe guttata]|eukprot:XP_012832962.1 PREDICTED: transmembrane emp24 domain-containing protein p24delta9-like [Erythranthe guttata]
MYTTMTVDFDWKSGVAAKDWSIVAKKDSVDLMEIELKKMVDAVQSIHEEIFYLRAREHEMQNLNKSTNSKMTLLSFLSLFTSHVCSWAAVLKFEIILSKEELI